MLRRNLSSKPFLLGRHIMPSTSTAPDSPSGSVDVASIAGFSDLSPLAEQQLRE